MGESVNSLAKVHVYHIHFSPVIHRACHLATGNQVALDEPMLGAALFHSRCLERDSLIICSIIFPGIEVTLTDL